MSGAIMLGTKGSGMVYYPSIKRISLLVMDMAMERVSMQNKSDTDHGKHMDLHRGAVLAPALLLFGATQFLLLLVAAEALYPGYSVATHAISDLGVGETAIIFNSSIVLFGAASFAAAYLLRRRLGRLLPVCMAFAGIGAICVGLFPETLGLPHYLSALTAFLFGGIAAIVSSQQVRMPFAFLFILLGMVTLLALGLEIANLTLGLGHGGMERMIAYPIIIWEIAFAGWLAGKTEVME